jgi:hypothetical protein
MTHPRVTLPPLRLPGSVAAQKAKEVTAMLDDQRCAWLLGTSSPTRWVECGKPAPYRVSSGYCKGELRCPFHWRPTAAAWAARSYHIHVRKRTKPSVLHRENERLIAAWRKEQEKAA